MKAVGIDIGTTTICGVLLDGGTGELLDSRTLSNDTAVRTENDWEHLQDPEKILEKCRRILEAFQDGEEDIVSVGVTGQMHGILYTDVGGRAVSPLYTWQDRRGDLPCKESRDGKEETWAGELSRKTGYPGKKTVPTWSATIHRMATSFRKLVSRLVFSRGAGVCACVCVSASMSRTPCVWLFFTATAQGACAPGGWAKNKNAVQGNAYTA